MDGLIFHRNRLQYKTQLNPPEPKPGFARIRVLCAGICQTDIEITRGYLPYAGILGHEFVGIVEESTDPSWIDQRVVGEININCGKCPPCQQHNPNHCEARQVMGIRHWPGAFAHYITLPLKNLHRVPATLDHHQAVWCEPLAAAVAILEQFPIKPTHHVTILGDGKLGLLIAQVLRLTGCHLTMVGHHPHKLAIAQQWGLETARTTDHLKSSSDWVVESTGNPEAIKEALLLVRPRGTIILKSTTKAATLLPPAILPVQEITITGSRCGPFAPPLRLLERQLIDTTALIEKIYPLEQGEEAFHHAMRSGSLKILLQINDA
ncbi:MDR/zinc-dependent alcohol dehydrogenase-like family protein [Magnetococcales bacterium HHB-1]